MYVFGCIRVYMYVFVRERLELCKLYVCEL